jgi:hypothetical protein
MDERKQLAVPLIAEVNFRRLRQLMGGAETFPVTYDAWLALWAERQAKSAMLGFAPLFIVLHVPAFSMFLDNRRLPGSWQTMAWFLAGSIHLKPA